MPSRLSHRKSIFSRRCRQTTYNEIQRENMSTVEEETLKSVHREQLRNHRLRVRNSASTDGSLLNEFQSTLLSLSYQICHKCNREWFADTLFTGICDVCRRKQHKFSAANNMQPGDVPSELENLTPIEQMLISRVQPVLSIYQLKAYGGNGQYRYRGNILNVEQDITPIANILPRTPSDLNILLIRRAGVSGYCDFTVRRKVVLDALQWLSIHNPYYADISISMENLQQLPDNGNIGSNLSYIKEDSISNEIIEDDEVYVNAISHNKHRKQQEVIRNQLNWPSGCSYPVNEFRDSGYIVKAFPHLFPYGKADFHDNTRTERLTFREWSTFLLQYRDRRFAKDPRFRYFCLNTVQRHEAISNGALYANISNFNGTVYDLQNRAKTDTDLLKRFLYFGGKIRGSNPYWYQRKTELTSIVNQLGVPTFFLTLSAADLWWPCLVRHFKYNVNKKSESVISKEMQKLLSENPLIADQYFMRRVEIFMKIIKKRFQINDFWYRIEYQHRGSPHLHGVFWLDGNPDVREFKNMTTEELNAAKEYYDCIMTAINPDSTARADEHPCRIFGTSHTFENDTSTAELINRVQRHTLCSETYCLRGPPSNKECRFGFPKTISTDSVLAKNDRGVFVYTPKRNDGLLNPYNRFISNIWRANTDVQIIASEHAIVSYITKYASKGEPRSEDFKQLMLSSFEGSNANDPVSKALSKFLMKIVGNRDVSACEVMHLLTGESLYRSSRQIIKLYISTTQSVLVLCNKEDNDNAGVSGNKIINAYKVRRPELESVSLAEFARKFSVKNARSNVLSTNRKERVIQVLPNVTKGNSIEADEIYFKQQLVLNLPWRSVEGLKTENTWTESYSASRLNIWELDMNLAEKEDNEVNEASERDRHDWQALAAALPHQVPVGVPLGCREIDRNFNWYESYYAYPSISENLKFVQSSKETFEANTISSSKACLAFNEEQRQVLEFVNEAISNRSDKKLAIVMGKAGTGKSAVIHEIVRRYGQENVLLMAPTGVAANNIGGQTIHSGLHLTISHNQSPLSGDRERDFQEQLANYKIIIVDEFSMIGLTVLGKMDDRLRQARPDFQDEPMGGFIVILFGDLNQLQPVMDSTLYGNPNTAYDMSVRGKMVYGEFKKSFFLTKIVRQRGDDQLPFKNTLSNIALGSITMSDYHLLSTRFIKENIAEANAFRDAVRLKAKNDDIAVYNYEKLRQIGKPVTVLKAIHNNETAASAKMDEANGLQVELPLCIGARIILRRNLWTACGLCNGSIGEVVDIIYAPNELSNVNAIPDELPMCILVRFESYSGPKFNGDGIPIVPFTSSFRKNGISGTRKQFPVSLAYAISIHRSQGLTLDKAVVDIGLNEFSLGLTYVGCSRVRKLTDLLFDPSFNIDRLWKINSKKSLITKRLELQRLSNLQ